MPYPIGTATVTSGSTAFSVAGINLTLDARPDDFLLINGDRVLAIATITSATTGTLQVASPVTLTAQPAMIEPANNAAYGADARNAFTKFIESHQNFLNNGLILMVDPVTKIKPATIAPVTPADIWRSDFDSGATPRIFTIASSSGTTLTITQPWVEGICGALMAGRCWVRVWNVTLNQSAWVEFLSTSQMTAQSAAQITGWANGQFLQVGDPNPTGTNIFNLIAIDISRYLQSQFGVIFRQRGIKAFIASQGNGGQVSLLGSGTGGAGASLGIRSNSNGDRQTGAVDIFTDQLSPISNSNLVFVQEVLHTGTSLSATRFIRATGVWL